ncbi:hypothetical protein GCM10020258_21390 [Sphingomonas yabuuchiae]
MGSFSPDVHDWLEMQDRRSVLPRPGQLLVETFPREGRHYMVAYSFEGGMRTSRWGCSSPGGWRHRG